MEPKEMKYWIIICEDCSLNDPYTPIERAYEPKRCPCCRSKNIVAHEQLSLF